MAYQIDAGSIDLNALKKRLRSADLIPSREPLLDGLAEDLAATLRKAEAQEEFREFVNMAPEEGKVLL